ncbi:PKD domain-containing protein [Desulfonema limicola]|uniref:PKD domain-containing protein n=1 Tax=Desulfonema limicola TaxID=45656 RepID=A0A975BD93_9BACT|nr:PKD domain-containing protein [Desulfonema limicola]QTA83198.1 PKD domain-containing protein [Desulfonema limicola]
MKGQFYTAALILFLTGTLFLSQAFGAEEELIEYFNPPGASKDIFDQDEFVKTFTFSGSAGKLVKKIQFGALLSAYYKKNDNETVVAFSASFRTTVTINGQLIIWSGIPFYPQPSSEPNPDIHVSTEKTVSDKIIISDGDIITIKIGMGDGGGILYNDNEDEPRKNYLKLILDDPPVNCDVSAAFALDNDPEKNIVLIGEEVTFTNTSTGTGLETAEWEWSFDINSPESLPEELKSLKEPKFTFTKAGTYTLQLAAAGKEGDAVCTTNAPSITFEVKCGVQADFTPSAYTIVKGESIQFINNSDVSGATAPEWEWSFDSRFTDKVFPENENDKENPTVYFDTKGSYIVILKATIPPDLCTTTNSRAVAVVDTNLSHAILGLKVLAGFGDTLSSTDKQLTDLVKDEKITLEDIISILRKIAGQ